MTLFSVPFLILIVCGLILFYALPKRFQWIVLLIMSIVFYYAAGGVKAGLFITVTILTTYYAALYLERLAEEQKTALKGGGEPLSKEEKNRIKESYAARRKRVFVLTMVFNFGILAVLKYTNFTLLNINGLLRLAGSGRQFAPLNLLLPLGISFYTFQMTGYLIDVSKGREKADRNLFRYALFASYFPQIIQGPISKHQELAGQLFGEHEFDEMTFRTSVLRMLWGYFKKMVIAENAAIIATEVISNFEVNNYKGFTVFVGLLFYGFQMYADFSGGIDIVLGVSGLFGIKLTENFKAPYMSRTVSEFWQRWHMSLGRWMKDYLFYPIALSKPFSRFTKKAKKRIGSYYGKILPSTIASFIVFVIVGIWHGAAWRYVAFGVFHATLTSLDSLLEKVSADTRSFLHIDGESLGWRLFQMARTLFLITMGRYFDCTDGLKVSFRLFRATFTSFNPQVFLNGTFYKLGLTEKDFRFTMYTIVVLLVIDVLNERGIVVREIAAKQGIVFRYAFYLLAIFMILIFGSYGPGYNAASFIYQGI